MNQRYIAAVLLPAILLGAVLAAAETGEDPVVERGRYLVTITGCNDCHTPGHLASAGETPEELWLTGDAFGWRGPWGTTYGSNLRIVAQALSEDQWVGLAQTLTARPPMPWFSLNKMKEEIGRAHV